MFDLYNKKRLWGYLLVMGLSLLLLKVTAGMAFGGIALVLLFQAIKRNQSEDYMFCLTMACAMMMANSWFVPKNLAFTIPQRLFVLILALIMVPQLAGRRSSRFIKPLMGILVFLLYMVLPSAMGWNPTISLLKILLFVTVFFAYLGVFNRILLQASSSAQKVRTVFLAFAAFFILGSMVLIPFPGISIMGLEDMLPGQELPVSLFKGMTIHSQSLGPAIASIMIVLFGDYIFSIRKGNKFYLLLLLSCPVLLYKTGSRTAMGAALAGLFFTVMLFMMAKGISGRWRGKVVGAIWGIVVVLGLIVACVGPVRERAIKFVTKFENIQGRARGSDISLEKVTSTRQGAMEESLSNFRQSPAIGNGFQVTKAYYRMKIAKLSQLLSAPIEKGVWITAILEEGGIFGLIVFCIFATYVLVRMYMMRAYIGCSIFFTMLVLNLGEFTIFSLTAVGGLIWFCVFVGVVFDGLRIKQEQQRNMSIDLPFAPPPDSFVYNGTNYAAHPSSFTFGR